MHLKTDILTDTGEKIAISVYFPVTISTGLVFIAHGLAGYQSECFLQTVRDVFLNQNLTVVMYDARYSLGKSDGPLEKACFSNFIADLNTVIIWTQKQPFYQEPFILVGHSLGAGACLHYAIQQPQNVSGIITLSAVYNGFLLLNSYQKNKPDFVKKWQKEQLLFKQREDFPEKSGYISYNHIIDALNYHLETQVDKIICPVLIICGDYDISSTIDINQTLFNPIKASKELVIISKCGHTYKTDQNRLDLQQTISTFILNLQKE